MSLFLAPIHSWLFNKIRLQNQLIESILKDMKSSVDTEAIAKTAKDLYGYVEDGELADIIDTGNIHGWLQERVNVVENKLAYVVTSILKLNPELLSNIKNTAFKFGENISSDSFDSPSSAYMHINGCILSGMPCDKVNEVVLQTDNEIVWKQNIDIHKQYWDNVGGDIKNYYTITDNIILGILDGYNFSYENDLNKLFTIKRG
jgi:hypothetical protein